MPNCPVPQGTVLDAFEAHARSAPESPSLRYFDDTITFGELNDRAERFAALLTARGIGKGERVALSLQNDPEFAVALLGAWKRGAVVVPLNPMFRQKKIEYHLRDSGARVWIALEELATPEHRAAAAARAWNTSSRDKGIAEPAGAARPDPGARVAARSRRHRSPRLHVRHHRQSQRSDDPAPQCRLQCRSLPGVDADGRRGFDPGGGATVSYHGAGGALATAFWTGIPLILFHRFDAAQALRLARKWRGTMTVAAITAYIALMNSPDESNGSFLAKCYSGGAPVAPGLVEQFEQRFGSYIHNIYGLTESASPTHATPLGARAPVDPASGALSIGVPIPNCEAKVVSLDDPAVELPPGEAGELALKGPFVFAGYWNRPDETSRAFHDGYFRTGDVAIMDEQGWFYLVDRKKDVIIASGFKIWPREVEDTLYQHPAVREAAVIGVPDPYRGESVKAFVALKEGCASTGSAEIVALLPGPHRGI